MHGIEHTAAEQPAQIGLVVEDDPALRRTAADVMAEAQVKSAEANTAEEALAFLREHAPDVRLVLTEFELPGRLDGIDLARVASLRWPWIKVLVASSATRISDVPQNVVFLPKPWCDADLRAQLQWETAATRATVAIGSLHRAQAVRH